MLFAIDIETTGLDPETARVLTVAMALDSGHVLILDRPDDEAELLAKLEEQLSVFFANLPGIHAVVTWNGSAFDLPFLARRFAEHGIPTSLAVYPTSELGKYGTPRFEGHWGGVETVDIAYGTYKDWSDVTGIKNSLKPTAEALLGIPPMDVVVSGPNGALDLDPEVRKTYCAMDAEMVLGLTLLMRGAYIQARQLIARNN